MSIETAKAGQPCFTTSPCDCCETKGEWLQETDEEECPHCEDCERIIRWEARNA